MGTAFALNRLGNLAGATGSTSSAASGWRRAWRCAASSPTGEVSA